MYTYVLVLVQCMYVHITFSSFPCLKIHSLNYKSLKERWRSNQVYYLVLGLMCPVLPVYQNWKVWETLRYHILLPSLCVSEFDSWTLLSCLCLIPFSLVLFQLTITKTHFYNVTLHCRSTVIHVAIITISHKWALWLNPCHYV